MLHLSLRHWKLALLFVFVAMIVTSVMHWTFPIYRATSSLYVKSVETSPILNASSKISGYEIRDYSNKPINIGYLQILRSERLYGFVEQKLTNEPEIIKGVSPEFLEEFGVDPSHSPLTNAELGKIAQNLVGSSYFSGRDDEIIEITVSSPSPKVAAEAANLMNKLSAAYLFDYESKEVADIERFLEGKLLESQKNIDKLNRELEEFKGRQSVLNITGHGVMNITQQSISRLREELEMIGVKLQENETITKDMERELSPNEANVPNLDNGSMRGRLLDNYRTLKDERRSLEAKRDALKNRLVELNATLKPQFEERIFEFTRKLETEHELYQELKKQISNLHVFRISIGSRVLDYTSADMSRASRQTPLHTKLIISIVVSLAILVLLVYVWDQMSPVVSDREDLSFFGVKHLGSIPIIADSPDLAGRLKSVFTRGSLKLRQKSWKDFSANRAGLAFQFLRTRLIGILRKGKNEPTKVVTIMSPNAGDGKSFVSVNLAIALGRFNLKAVIVDCDIMKSSTTKFFDIDAKEGLVDYVTRDAKLEPLIVQSEYPNVYFLPSGPRATNFDILASRGMEKLFNSLRDKFDVILLDTPAFAAGPEASILANMSDHILLVVNAYQTKLQDLSELLDNISPQNANQIYGVLNRHESSFNSSYNTYYMMNTNTAHKTGADRAS